MLIYAYNIIYLVRLNHIVLLYRMSVNLQSVHIGGSYHKLQTINVYNITILYHTGDGKEHRK